MVATERAGVQAALPAAREAAFLSDNPMQKFGFALLVAFLFIAFGRVTEVIQIPHMAMLSALVSLVAALVIGGVPFALGSRAGLLLCVFTGLMVIGAPFSVWKGGSIALIKDDWSRAFMTFIIVAASIHGFRQCRTTVYTLAWATAFIVITSRFRATSESGRLAMNVGTLSNPNDFAAYLLLGLPFCLYGIITKGEPKLLRFLGVLLLPMVAVLILKTGSRSGLLTFAVVLVFLFFKVSPQGKLAMIVPAALLVLALPFVIPQTLIDRYATILDDDVERVYGGTDAERQAGFASSSSAARRNLLIKSLILTLKNPLLGVGPGMFPLAVSDYAKELGERPPWQQTHNTYTQVSSEMGVPALIVYVMLLGYCIRTTNAVQKLAKKSAIPELQKLGNLAFCLQMAWIGFCVNSMFGSFAYHIHVPMLAGITEAIRRAALPYAVATQPAFSRVAPSKFAGMVRTR